MTIRRCLACGGFFDADECPNDHSYIEAYMPSLPPPVTSEMRGRVVRYQGQFCVVVGNRDENGMVGLSPLHERIRAYQKDLERID